MSANKYELIISEGKRCTYFTKSINREVMINHLFDIINSTQRRGVSSIYITENRERTLFAKYGKHETAEIDFTDLDISPTDWRNAEEDKYMGRPVA